MFPETYGVDTPFDNCEDDKENLEWFRNSQIDLYKECALGKVTACFLVSNGKWKVKDNKEYVAETLIKRIR